MKWGYFMISKASLILVSFLLFASANARGDSLRVVFDEEGCPSKVLGYDSCPGRSGDNVACRHPGPVRWVPENQIGSVATKDGSEDLHRCRSHAAQGYYQCIIQGNVGQEVEYYVESKDGCSLDPIIIIN